MIWWICKDKLHMHGDGYMGDWIFFSSIVEMWLDCTCRSGRWVCGGSFFLLPNVEMWFNHTCRSGRRVKQSGLNTFQSLWIDQLMQLSKLLLALSWTVAALKYSVCFSNPMLLTVEPSFWLCNLGLIQQFYECRHSSCSSFSNNGCVLKLQWLMANWDMRKEHPMMQFMSELPLQVLEKLFQNP